MGIYYGRKITKNQIENMGIAIYGFGYCQGPDAIFRGEYEYMGYNSGIYGWNYDCFIHWFADGTPYIIVEGHRVPKKWIEKGKDFYNDYDKAMERYCNARYAGIF